MFTEPDWCSRWPKNALIHGIVAYVCSSCFFYSKYVYFFFKFYLKIGVKTDFRTKKFHTAIAPGQMWSVNVGISSNLVLTTIKPGCSWEIPKTISLYGICSTVKTSRLALIASSLSKSIEIDRKFPRMDEVQLKEIRHYRVGWRQRLYPSKLVTPDLGSYCLHRRFPGFCSHWWEVGDSPGVGNGSWAWISEDDCGPICLGWVWEIFSQNEKNLLRSSSIL